MSRNLPKIINNDLAMQFKDVKFVNEVRSIMNIYMLDRQTGMPRGQIGPMLCMAADGQTEQTEDKTNITNNTGANGGSSSVCVFPMVQLVARSMQLQNAIAKTRKDQTGTANDGIAASGATRAENARTSTTHPRVRVPWERSKEEKEQVAKENQMVDRGKIKLETGNWGKDKITIPITILGIQVKESEKASMSSTTIGSMFGEMKVGENMNTIISMVKIIWVISVATLEM